MKYIVLVLVNLFFFLGCVNSQPKLVKEVSVVKIVDNNKTKEVLETNQAIFTTPLEEKTIEKNEMEEGHIILNVFDDELYFEKDKVGEDKTKVVIKYLNTFAWEKKALKKIYRKHQRLWSKKQSKDFRRIITEDKYLSLCSAQKYWDNLEFEESQPEQDILQSILLIKYLNNLTHGCPQWVGSDGEIKNENSKERINTKQVFSLLPHGVIIEKLFSLYLPHKKEFSTLLKNHKRSLELAEKKDLLKAERLELEMLKCEKCQPNYKKKRK